MSEDIEGTNCLVVIYSHAGIVGSVRCLPLGSEEPNGLETNPKSLFKNPTER